MSDENTFQQTHHTWVDEEMKNDPLQRNRIWSEAIAIGNNDFVEDVNRRLKDKGNLVSKEPATAYSTLFDGKKGPLSYENTYYIGATC